MGMSNSDVAYDVVGDVLEDLSVKSEREESDRFDEIAQEVIKRLRKQGIEVDKYDVAEMLDYG